MQPDSVFREPPLTEERKEELRACIKQMHTIASSFYRAAIQCHNHAFIEFCGFMTEYIKICEATLEAGIDFTNANTHSGKTLLIGTHQAAYVGEKFDCIFGPTLRSDPQLMAAFLSAQKEH